jgi:hypothetical protein
MCNWFTAIPKSFITVLHINDRWEGLLGRVGAPTIVPSLPNSYYGVLITIEYSCSAKDD